MAGGISLVVVSIISIMVVFALRPGRLSEAVLVFFVASFGQIVVATVVLSEFRAIGTGGYLAFHFATLLAASVITLRMDARLPALPTWAWPRPLSASMRSVQAGLVLAGAIGLALILVHELYWAASIRSLPSDVAAYHVPRAYFWMGLGSARHMPVEDFRMTEFPPNTSFLLTWIFVFFGKATAAIHGPQWLGALVLGIVTARLAALLGGDRWVQLAVATVSLCSPIVLTQAGTALNDLVVGAMIAIAVLFLVLAMEAPSDREAIRDVGLAVSAFALALGSKPTALYAVPILGMLGVVLIWTWGAQRLRRRLGASLLLAASAVLLFAAYNFVLNLAEFGGLFTSSRADAILRINFTAERTATGANVLRYVHGVFDWTGLASTRGAWPVWLTDRLFDTLLSGERFFRWLGTDLRSLLPFPKPSSVSSGFSPIIGLALLISPFVAMSALLSGWRRKDRSFLLITLLILGAWIAILIVAATRPWTHSKFRYFIPLLPLLLVAVAAALSRWARTLRWVGITALGATAVSLVAGIEIVRLGDNALRPQVRAAPGFVAGQLPIEREWGGIFAGQPEMLKTLFPEGGVLGIYTRMDTNLAALLAAVPEISVVPMRRDDVAQSLRSGSIQGALITADHPKAGEAIPVVNHPELRLLVPNPEHAFNAIRSIYRLQVIDDAAGTIVRALQWSMTTFTGNLLGYWPHWKAPLLIPQAVFSWRNAPLHVLVRFENRLDTDRPVQLVCIPDGLVVFGEEHQSRQRPSLAVSFERTNSAIAFTLPPECLANRHTLALVELRRQPGGTVPRIYEITYASGTVPDSQSLMDWLSSRSDWARGRQ